LKAYLITRTLEAPGDTWIPKERIRYRGRNLEGVVRGQYPDGSILVKPWRGDKTCERMSFSFWTNGALQAGNPQGPWKDVEELG
jgi:hypothetical protein